jgi:hypothetical protein
MELGIGAEMGYDEMPNKGCSVILREVYKRYMRVLSGLSRPTRFPRSVESLSRFRLNWMGNVSCCAFFSLSNVWLLFLFIHLLFFSFRSPFCTPNILQMHLPLPVMDLNISKIIQP